MLSDKQLMDTNWFDNEEFEPIEYALVNYKNYGFYADMIKNKTGMIIYVPNDITTENIDDHIENIFNILKDGVETDYIHECKITIKWENTQCNIHIIDYWLSLMMWEMILKTNHPIRPKHIFLGSKVSNLTQINGRYFPWEVSKKDIKNYINKFILTLENKIQIGNVMLNKIIAHSMWRFSYIEHFYYYLANTVNNEDDIELMRVSPEFNQCLHASLYGVPIEQVKDEGMKIANKAIEIIKDSERYIGYEHGLTNSFRASEGINLRQFKEASINIGTKPNGRGGIFTSIIDKNFKTGGVSDALSYFIESSTARTAQILSKINVGDSGEFARLLGLNNTDTILNPNPEYMCMSQNYTRFEIKSKTYLSMIKGRYYRDNPRGMDKMIDYEDYSMVGKVIYLHSPMKCASHSSGHGICRKCYGSLYFVNFNINVGKIAAEILSEQLTKRLLSAKHLIETLISTIKWNAEFKDYFDVDINSIKLSEELDDEDELKKYILIIDPNEIQLVSDEEDAVTVDQDEDSSDDDSDITMDVVDDTGVYNEYITNFIIRTPDGRDIVFGSEDQQELYISTELNTIIRKKAFNIDGKAAITLNNFIDSTLFYIKINNNELSKTMKDIKNVIDKSSVTENLSPDEALQSLVDLVVSGNLTIDSVHLEVILSNQIVDPKDIYKKPNWNSPEADYRMLTLNQALTNNPSVVISLLYKDLNKVLYNPLTYAKRAPSFFDLFLMVQPQKYISDELITTDTSNIRDLESKIQMYELVKPSGVDKEKLMMEKIEKHMTPEELEELKSKKGK